MTCLPGLFALGVRVLAAQPQGHRGAGAVAGAAVCFAVCAAPDAYGIFLLLAK
jgi:hypothetical protein